ncbi:hypothetical protein RB13251 [Rhodopirellula baltica SH 1]|uniref:Uncharacterized protein n=1 Tax=Rhodopirellula baltica (strain DSM 10527 / NCIMB 13988 / SH1) TaxID=243090 RepID=Q7UHE7_RHOBA|nr:hypothetical protein RB13251 [Rhodopirellula baltica SH 1]
MTVSIAQTSDAADPNQVDRRPFSAKLRSSASPRFRRISWRVLQYVFAGVDCTIRYEIETFLRRP